MRVQRLEALEIGLDPVNDGYRLRSYYTNQGDPYREGCNLSLEFQVQGYPSQVAVIFLNTGEAAALRDWLDRLIQRSQT